MADLTPFVFQGQLPRARGRARAPRTGQLPPQAPGDATAPALERFGAVVERIGEVVGQLDQQFVRAQADVQGTEAVNTLVDRMQARALALRDDPTVLPMDKATTFGQEFERAVTEGAEQLPLLAKPAFVRLASQARRQLTRQLTDAGRAETVARGTQAFQTFQLQIGQALVRAENDVERAELLTGLRDVGQQYVRNGVLSAEQVAATVVATRQNAALQRAELLIATQPAVALTELRSGAENMPDLPADQVPELIMQAQQAVDQALTRHERQDRLAEKALGERQDVTASAFRMQVYSGETSIQDLQVMQREVNMARQRGELSEGDHAELLRTIPSLIDSKLTIGRRVRGESSDTLRRDYTIMLETARDTPELDAIRERIVADAPSMDASDVSTLLTGYNQRRDKAYFANRDSYREGVRLIQERAGFPGTGLMAVIQERIDPRRQSQFAQALDLYRETMRPLSPEDIDARAIPLAKEIREQFFPATTEDDRFFGIPAQYRLPVLDADERLRQDNVPLSVRESILRQLNAIEEEDDRELQNTLFEQRKQRQSLQPLTPGE